MVSSSAARWRNSFFFSLIFGVPVMVIMIVFMVMMSMHDDDEDGGMMNGGGNGSDRRGNGTMIRRGPHGMMVMSGLSLENLLLFLFCTPCQVRGGAWLGWGVGVGYCTPVRGGVGYCTPCQVRGGVLYPLSGEGCRVG